MRLNHSAEQSKTTGENKVSFWIKNCDGNKTTIQVASKLVCGANSGGCDISRYSNASGSSRLYLASDIPAGKTVYSGGKKGKYKTSKTFHRMKVDTGIKYYLCVNHGSTDHVFTTMSFDGTHWVFN